MLVAAIQMVSGTKIQDNLKIAAEQIAQAVDAGAKMVMLPEEFAMFGQSDTDRVAIKEQEGAGEIQDFLHNQSSKHRVWLVGGTLPLACEDETRVRSACLVFDDQGQQVGRYDKMHLFDAMVNDSKGMYQESRAVQAGNSVVTVPTPFGRLGLTVCYDVRFPELYRELLIAGAEIIAVPAAFTAATGAFHWEVLLRARAIENLCYVVAPNQGGMHENGRETYGHTMIVEPWGEVCASLEQGPGFVTCDIDLEHLHNIRQRFPATTHRKMC